MVEIKSPKKFIKVYKKSDIIFKENSFGDDHVPCGSLR